MQVQNNVSFGSIQRVMVPPKAFSKAGQDVVKDVIAPYAKSISSDVMMFVGSPKFPKIIKEILETGYGDTKKCLNRYRGMVPRFLSENQDQPLYIVTGKEDIEAVKVFSDLRAGSEGETRKAYGILGELIENVEGFTREFGAKIKNVGFSEILEKSKKLGVKDKVYDKYAETSSVRQWLMNRPAALQELKPVSEGFAEITTSKTAKIHN